MKKIILLLAWATIAINAAKSQEYDAHDLGKLKAFLIQPSAIAGKTNGEVLGLTALDMLTWGTGDGWLEALRWKFNWSSGTPRRLRQIELAGESTSGTLDMSGCDSLWRLQCTPSELIGVDVRDCGLLEEVYCSQNRLTSLQVTGCPVLWRLSCHDNLLTSIDVSGCPSLTFFTCSNNPLTEMRVGWAVPKPVTSLPADLSAATLYVPFGTASLYRSTARWNEFGTIVEDAELSTAFLPSPLVTVFSIAHLLTVLTPFSESLTLYSPSGSLLFRSSKLPGHATFTIGHLPKGVIIVKGSTGWVRKIFR